MTQEKIEMFILTNQKNFESSQIPIITEKLKGVDDDKLMLISTAKYKDPIAMLIISLFLGGFGVDRFILGDTGVGVLKLLTGGCFGILTIVDWFTIMSKSRQKNFALFMANINLKNTFNSIKPSMENNNIEEIKKLKKLLDAEIITKEEYEKKKKELLWKI